MSKRGRLLVALIESIQTKKSNRRYQNRIDDANNDYDGGYAARRSAGWEEYTIDTTGTYGFPLSDVFLYVDEDLVTYVVKLTKNEDGSMTVGNPDGSITTLTTMPNSFSNIGRYPGDGDTFSSEYTWPPGSEIETSDLKRQYDIDKAAYDQKKIDDEKKAIEEEKKRQEEEEKKQEEEEKKRQDDIKREMDDYNRNKKPGETRTQYQRRKQKEDREKREREERERSGGTITGTITGNTTGVVAVKVETEMERLSKYLCKLEKKRQRCYY